MTRGAVRRLKSVLNNSKISVNLKSEVSNTCTVPVVAFGLKKLSKSIKAVNRLHTVQRGIERLMMKISLRDHVGNEEK